MNACLIAACVANSRARRKEEPVCIPTEELYYKVNLRKYYRFNPMSLADFTTPICKPAIADCCSITPMSPRVVSIDARSSAVQQSFSVRASKCSNGIDSYIRENLNKITSSVYWLEQDKQVIHDYIKYVDLWYGIKLREKDVVYTAEYYWEVS